MIIKRFQTQNERLKERVTGMRNKKSQKTNIDFSVTPDTVTQSFMEEKVG